MHSMLFDPSRCTGCTACVKVCPTEAIRVSRSKAVVYDRRCIDCGRCMQACTHHAFSVRSDGFEKLKDYKYNIAMPDSVLYGQFNNLDDGNIVNEGLIALGFDDVWPCAMGAELLTAYYRKNQTKLLHAGEPRITSECPAVTRLIAMEYQELIPSVTDRICSFEVTAIAAREAAVKKTGLQPEEIGICLISPCPAKNTRVYHPIGLEERVVDYVLPVNDVYVALLSPMKRVGEPRDFMRFGSTGLSWSRTGGQCAIVPDCPALAVDGATNVESILGELEDEKIGEAALVELSLCTQSCFGGCLTVENPYTAKLRMRAIDEKIARDRLEISEELENRLEWDFELEEIDTDIAETISQALQIEAAAERTYKTLPKFDCGNCGAPSCRAFARDVAEGFAEEGDCIFNIIKAMRGGIGYEEELDEFVPPPFRRPLN